MQANAFITQVVNPIKQILGLALPILFVLAILYFVWGLAKYILAAGDDGSKAEGRNIMTWGVIALFVMVSVWGLVAILANTFDIRTNEPSPVKGSSDIGKLIPLPK